jgi:uncharacterized protein YbaR (Trm112 family)
MKPPLILLWLLLLSVCLLGCRKAANPEAQKPVVPEGFDERALEKLRCPENGSTLRFAQRKELDGINDRIGAMKLKTWAGTPQTKHVQAVLIRADGKIGYQVDQIMPVMEIMEALVLDDSVGNPDPNNHRK